MLPCTMAESGHIQRGTGVETPSLDYTITEVKLPVLYDRCRAQRLAEQTDDSKVEALQHTCTPCDAAPWGAKEAWQLGWQDTGPSDWYLLCYADSIVEIHFSWTPTAEQMALVGEKLGTV